MRVLQGGEDFGGAVQRVVDHSTSEAATHSCLPSDHSTRTAFQCGFPRAITTPYRPPRWTMQPSLCMLQV